MGGEWAKAVKKIFDKKYSNGRGKLVDAMKDPETRALHQEMLGKKPMKMTKMNNTMNNKMKKTQKYKKTKRGGVGEENDAISNGADAEKDATSEVVGKEKDAMSEGADAEKDAMSEGADAEKDATSNGADAVNDVTLPIGEENCRIFKTRGEIMECRNRNTRKLADSRAMQPRSKGPSPNDSKDKRSDAELFAAFKEMSRKEKEAKEISDSWKTFPSQSSTFSSTGGKRSNKNRSNKKGKKARSNRKK